MRVSVSVDVLFSVSTALASVSAQNASVSVSVIQKCERTATPRSTIDEVISVIILNTSNWKAVPVAADIGLGSIGEGIGASMNCSFESRGPNPRIRSQCLAGSVRLGGRSRCLRHRSGTRRRKFVRRVLPSLGCYSSPLQCSGTATDGSSSLSDREQKRYSLMFLSGVDGPTSPSQSRNLPWSQSSWAFLGWPCQNPCWNSAV